MPESEDQYLDIKDIIALIVVGGFFIVFVLLFFVTVPTANKDFVNTAIALWGASGFVIIVKRFFDSTDSSDKKNATIQTMATALAQAAPTDPTKAQGQ